MRKISYVKTILILALSAFVLCCVVGCGKKATQASQQPGDSAGSATEPVLEERDLFYFNIDKVLDSSAVRQKDRVSGLYTIRLLKEGQIVELQTSRDNIPQQIDNQKALVLTFDDEGYIKKFQSAQSALGGQFYDGLTVTAVDGSTVTVSSRVGNVSLAEDVIVYDLTGLTAEIGAYGEVKPNDVICCYEDENGLVTHVYIISRRPEHDSKHTCEHCGSAVEWIAWDGEEMLQSGHYYLTADVQLFETKVISKEDVSICLNGYALTGKQRLFELKDGATVNIIDHAGYTGSYMGSVVGGGIATKNANPEDLIGGTFKLGKDTSLNIYGGNIGVDYPADQSRYVNRGGVIYSEGSVTISGGVITGAEVAYSGGAIYIAENGSFDMSGGVLRYGSAYKKDKVSGSGRGGTIYIHKGAAHAEISGGKLIAGMVDGYGGGLYTEISVKISNATLCGDRIDGTTLAEYGGVLWAGGVETVVDLEAGTVLDGGSSIEGGNIGVRNGCVINLHEGAVVQNGYGSRNGGNAAVFGTLNIEGGKVLNGYSDGSGGNIYCFTNGETILNVRSGLISGGSGNRGGNICMNGSLSYENGSVLNITGGEIRDGVARTHEGGNIVIRVHSIANITGGTITGGTAEKAGGGICTTYTADSDTATTLNIGGSAVISGNNGSDVYIVANTCVNLLYDVPLTDAAQIGLAADDASVALVNDAYDGCLDHITWTPGDKTLVIIKEQIFAQ